MFRFLIIVGVLCSNVAFAGTTSSKTCRRAFKADVVACAKIAKSVNRSSLRVSVFRGCIQEAVVEVKSCLSSCGGGGDQCLTDCQSTYDQSIMTCTQTHDPALCPVGDADCEIAQLNQRAACVSDADAAYNSCTQNCN